MDHALSMMAFLDNFESNTSIQSSDVLTQLGQLVLGSSWSMKSDHLSLDFSFFLPLLVIDVVFDVSLLDKIQSYVSTLLLPSFAEA